MRKLTKLTILVIFTLTVTAVTANANNIHTDNVELYESASQPAGTIDIKFDVAWDNSFGLPGTDLKDGNAASYFDRAWIFVKYYNTTTQTWEHATLMAGGSLSTYSTVTCTGVVNGFTTTATATATISGGAVTGFTSLVGGTGYESAPKVLLTGGGGVGATATATMVGGVVTAVNIATAGTGYTTAPTVSFSVGKGAFAVPGVSQTVRWNRTADGLLSTDAYKVQVMAIEMVRVPTGAFDIGDGIGGVESTNAFHVTDNTKLTINTTLVGSIKVDVNGYDDDQIELTGIGIDGDGGLDTDNNGTIDNASFPTGYNAFYIMKYEVTQGQYRDFLNTLTRAQQAARVATVITAGTTSVTNRYVMNNTPDAANIASANNYRNGIRCDATIHTSNPVTFYCDYNNNGVGNESTDGEWIACNYISWADLSAFADWAGLRPMTELEFEKACRGGGVTDSVTGVYAWGNTTLETATSSLTTLKIGTALETPNQGNCNYSSCTPDGPYRVGSYADSTSTRQNSGASYYGVMDLSGSLWERPVTVGNGTSGTVIGGRAFTGSHGDGVLTTLTSYQGNATNPDWPGYDTTYPTRGVFGAVGSGFRGGNWLDGAAYARASDRRYAASTNPGRHYYSGGRLARTSP